MGDEERVAPNLFEVRALLDQGNFLLTVRAQDRWHIWRVHGDNTITVVDRYAERMDEGRVEVLARPRVPRLTALFEALEEYDEAGGPGSWRDSKTTDTLREEKSVACCGRSMSGATTPT